MTRYRITNEVALIEIRALIESELCRGIWEKRSSDERATLRHRGWWDRKERGRLD